jgi:Galactose oxidase, central domain
MKEAASNRYFSAAGTAVPTSRTPGPLTARGRSSRWPPTLLFRSGAVMAFDEATSQLVLFGGESGTTSLNDTWVWVGRSNSWASYLRR